MTFTLAVGLVKRWSMEFSGAVMLVTGWPLDFGRGSDAISRRPIAKSQSPEPALRPGSGAGWEEA
eukprot:11465032-Alexandrium_andersonii.AAC.1